MNKTDFNGLDPCSQLILLSSSPLTDGENFPTDERQNLHQGIIENTYKHPLSVRATYCFEGVKDLTKAITTSLASIIRELAGSFFGVNSRSITEEDYLSIPQVPDSYTRNKQAPITREKLYEATEKDSITNADFVLKCAENAARATDLMLNKIDPPIDEEQMQPHLGNLNEKNKQVLDQLLDPDEKRYLVHDHNVKAISSIVSNYEEFVTNIYLEFSENKDKKEIKKEFKLEYQLAKSKSAPIEYEKTHTIELEEKEIKVTENLKKIDSTFEVCSQFIELKLKELNELDKSQKPIESDAGIEIEDNQLLTPETENSTRKQDLKAAQTFLSEAKEAQGNEEGNPVIFRPSCLKNEKKLQYFPTNAQRHTLKDKNDTLISDVITHGVIGTHGRKEKKGLTALIKERAKLEQKESSLSPKETARLEKLNEEIEARKDIVTSQALTILVDAVRNMSEYSPEALQDALDMGELLFHSNTLLSSWGAEQGMIEDMEWAMQDLLANVTFHFDDKIEENSSLRLEKGEKADSFVVHLPTLKDGNGAEKLHVTPVFYAQGVNEYQSLHAIVNLFHNDEDTEARINQSSWKKHKEYFNKFKQMKYKALVRELKNSEDSFLGGLPSTYPSEDFNQDGIIVKLEEIKRDLKKEKENSEFVKKHENAIKELDKLIVLEKLCQTIEDAHINAYKYKDVEMLYLLSEFTNRMSGYRTICCKSGKDRTGQEVGEEMAHFAKLYYGLNDRSKRILSRIFRLKGPRIENLEDNEGVKEYALNPFTTATLPVSFQAKEVSKGMLSGLET